MRHEDKPLIRRFLMFSGARNYKNLKQHYTQSNLPCKQTDSLSSSLGIILIKANPQHSRKKRRYECMQRFPDLFIVFYSWKEFGHALSVSRNRLTVRKTLSLRDFPSHLNVQTIFPLVFFFQISAHTCPRLGTRNLYAK